VSEVSDRELVNQLQNGQLDALGELYNRYQRLVFRTVLAITGDYDAAGDLLHEVFLRLYYFIDKFDVSRPLQPWLYRMSTNLAYTWLKQNRNWWQSIEDMAEWLNVVGKRTPHELVVQKDDRERVQRALNSLPVAQRIVVVLYYLNDLSIQDISEILEIPAGTVKSRLHYGRKLLKKELEVRGLEDIEKLPDFKYEGS
jgi:RNA polymerase sigma-70 factor (ECF subfamily)